MRALVTLRLTVLIVFLAVLSTSMVFVAAAALATIYVYVSTHSLVASLAAGIAGWMGLSLVSEFFAGLQDCPSAERG
ncbi:MAG TPA: hypothetical protein VK902_11335 [Rubrobacter sp.]|nr:hypothetical protein [Rubrobacter sp.]